MATYGRRVLLQQAAAGLMIAGAGPPHPPALLVLGDSLAAGYGLPAPDGFQARLQQALAAHGHPATLIDGAVSGDTSAGGRARLGWLLGGQKPDAAIVELGGNDGLRALPTEAMRGNIAAILDQLAQAAIPTLLSGMYPPPNYGQDYTAAFRAVFDGLGRRPGLLYDPFFLEGVALHPDLLQPDGIHPNAAGVRRIVARLLPLVERLLARVKA